MIVHKRHFMKTTRLTRSIEQVLGTVVRVVPSSASFSSVLVLSTNAASEAARDKTCSFTLGKG